MGTLLSDLRFALRLLGRAPGFVASAALVLGLGVGASAAVFTLASGILLRPLPVAEPERLVWLTEHGVSGPRNLSYPHALEYRDGAAAALAGIAGYGTVRLALAGDGEPERVEGQIATAGYFDLLGVRPLHGRGFLPEEEGPGERLVAVVGHDLWHRRFGADPALVGREVVLDSRPFTVVGIAPPGFVGLEAGQPAEVWVPMAAHRVVLPWSGDPLAEREASWLRTVARLRDGVSVDQATAAAAVVARADAHGSHDPRGRQAREERSPVVTPLTGPLHPGDRADVVPALVLLLGVTGLVVLIACANVANLLLGRAAARRREIGIRLSLGATRWRLVRQLLTESLLLGLAGGCVGLVLAAWTTDALLAFAELPVAVRELAVLDGRVLAFTLVVAVGTGLLFGLTPALHAVRPGPALRDEALALGGYRRGGRGGRWRVRRVSRSRLQGLLVAGQVALSLVLVVCSGLLGKSLLLAAGASPGFDVAHQLSLSFDLTTQGYAPEAAAGFERELLARAAAVPGVRSAALASIVPRSGLMIGSEAFLPGQAAGDEPRRVYLDAVTPGYFATLDLPLLAGRDIGLGDVPGAPAVAIVNETAAKRFWPGRSPLGQRLSLDGPEGDLVEVVGVARDVVYDSLSDPPRPFLYLSHWQHPDLLAESTLLVRAAGDPAPLARPLTAEIRAMDAALPVFEVRTLREIGRLRLAKERAVATLLGTSGALALLLAAMGLYGVIAYTVAMRTREIGVRMALGAAPRQVLGQLVGEGLRLALIGVAAGLVLALGAARLIAGMLYGVGPADAATFGGVALLLTAVAAAASWLPARRAARVDPVVTLRAE